MPSVEVQTGWTGNSGTALLQQSLGFIGAVSDYYETSVGRSLQGATILDYGCGWGRLIRLLYKFTTPNNIYGCDAWEKSLQHCKDAGVKANLMICDEIPQKLPFEDIKFDLAIAFSVFTHLSERTGLAVIAALRDRIAPDGLLAVTVRPLNYWALQRGIASQSHIDIDQMESDHRTRGFAFTPHLRAPIDGELTYGDTSMTIDYIREHWKGWEFVDTRSVARDENQAIVFLRPA